MKAPTEREYDVDVAWADYRKEIGVKPHCLRAAHKAFLAGWEAARGKSNEGGPLR